MKFVLNLLLTCAFAFSGHAAEPTAKTLKKCPNGHADLKDVPIVYGLLNFDGPEGEKTKRALENLEFVGGGCISFPHSPKHEVICKACRFSHSIPSVDRPDEGTWSGISSDLAAFPKPFSTLAMSFPVPPKLREPRTLMQGLNDKLEVQWEGVSYDCDTPPHKLKSQINSWLKANKIEHQFKSEAQPSVPGFGKCDLLQWETEELFVSVTLSYDYAKRSSYVSASFYAPRKKVILDETASAIPGLPPPAPPPAR